MTTTVMRNSRVGDKWIQDVCALNPAQWEVNADGQRTGNLLTGPVRLSWVNLFEQAKDKKTGELRGFGATCLFTPYTDFATMYEAYYIECARSWPEKYDAATQQYYGLHSPFRQQAEKLQYGGYTPGLVSIAMKTQFKPSIVDTRFNPIVDQSKVYPGVWAIVLCNTYKSGANQPVKGVGFGIQSVMIIGDDENIGQGGGVDPRKAFAGVKAGAPMAAPAAAFGAPPAPSAPGFGTPPTGALYGPGAGFVPQTPSQGMPSMAPPMAPSYAPAAPGFAAPAPDDEDMSQFL